MSKLLMVTVLVAIAALMACSGGDPTRAPTATTAPAPAETFTATPLPTATATTAPKPTPEPTGTTAPEPTATPEPESTVAELPTVQPLKRGTGSGRLVPLNVDDREAIAAELSHSELACISEVAMTDDVLQFFARPELASPEEQTHFLNCMEDNTVTRMFLTGLIDDASPLSEETSMCIRSGMEILDLRSVMLAGVGGDPGASMAGSMTAFFLTLSCLNEEEWQIASPGLGMGPDDRKSLQCVTSQLGGPEGVAAAMQPRDGEPPTAYINAAMACGLQTAGAPGPGMPGPTGMNDTGLLTSDLSGAELSCLSEIGDPQQLLTLMNSPELAPPQERDALVGCLEHETLLKLFLKGFTDQTGPLSSDTSACVSTGFQNIDLRAMMLTNAEGSGEEAAMVQGMAGFLIALACLNEEEWQAASPALDLQPDDRESLQCVMSMLGGPEGVAASLESKEGEPPLAFFNAAAECGLTMMEGPSG